MKILPHLLRPLAVSTAAVVAIGIGLLGAPRAEAVYDANFIPSIVDYAQRTHRDFGVPASVTIAQAILESGWGASSLSKDYNNYFGIKCNGNISPYMLGCVSKTTNEWYGTTMVTVTASFRTYSSQLNSFLDHANILKVNSRYANAFNYVYDPDQFAVEIALAGYATDPNYASSLSLLMSRYNLYQYDLKPPTASPSPTASASSSASATSSATATATATASATASPSVTATPTRTPTASATTMPVLAVTFPTLAYNASGYRVRVAQYFLAARGYYVPATGWYGPMTQGAVRRFQTAAGLRSTGTIDSATFAKLTMSATYGQTSNSVKALQTALNSRGFSVLITGYYGNVTLSQLRAFATRSGLGTVPTTVTNTVWSRLLK